MSGTQAFGPVIMRKPVPIRKRSPESDDNKTLEQIDTEYGIRPNHDDQIPQPLWYDGQPMAGDCDKGEQSHALKPSLGIELDNLIAKPPAFIPDRDTSHTTPSEADSFTGSKTNTLDQERKRKNKDVLWTPLYLRRTTFSLFIFVFVVILIALAVLYSYSERNQGLSTANPNLHYLWTYGPTAGE